MSRSFFALAFALALVGFAQAAHSQEGDASTDARKHKWFCTATGYDWDGRFKSVSGDFKPTQEEAEKSAVQLCWQFGYMTCSAGSCFDESI